MGRYGNFYVGPLGFLFKRSSGATGHRNFPLATICNQPQDVNNSYVPGSGIGASSTSNRRAKLNHATKCTGQYPCNKSFSRLGLYAQGGSNLYSLNWYIPTI